MKINGIIATKIAIGVLATASIGTLGLGVYIKGVKDDLYDQGTDYNYAIKDSELTDRPIKAYEEIDLKGKEIKYLALNEEYVIGDVSSYDYQNPMSDYMSEIMHFMKEPTGIETILTDGGWPEQTLATYDVSILKGSAYLNNIEDDYIKHTLENPTLDTWLNEVKNNEDLKNKIKDSNYITVEFGTMDLINNTISANTGREYMYGEGGSIGDFLSMFSTVNPYGLFKKDTDEIKQEIISKYLELVKEIKYLSPGSIINSTGVKHINSSLHTTNASLDKNNSKFYADEYLYDFIVAINGEISHELEVLDEEINLGASLYIDPMSNRLAEKESNSISGLTLAQHRADFTMLEASKLFLRTNIEEVLPTYLDSTLDKTAFGKETNEEAYTEYIRKITFPTKPIAYETSILPELTDIIFKDFNFTTNSKHLSDETLYMSVSAKEIYNNYNLYENQGTTTLVYLGVDDKGVNITVDFSKEIVILTQLIYNFDKIDISKRESIVDNLLLHNDIKDKEKVAKLIFEKIEIEFNSSKFILPNIPGTTSNDWKAFINSNEAIKSNTKLMEYLGL